MLARRQELHAALVAWRGALRARGVRARALLAGEAQARRRRRQTLRQGLDAWRQRLVRAAAVATCAVDPGMGEHA